MVVGPGALELLQVGVEVLGREERGPVHAGEHLPV
jgi:hypothetical protein